MSGGNLSYMYESDKGFLKVMIPSKSLVIYKINYLRLKDLKNRRIVQNDFITYILYKKEVNGKDKIYVGMSSKGLRERPCNHENLEENWDVCYVITDEGSSGYFNGSVAEYFENSLRRSLEHTSLYLMYTKSTRRDPLQGDDYTRILSDKVLEDTRRILESLGLSFDDSNSEGKNKLLERSDEFDLYPDGIPVYYKSPCKDTMVFGMYFEDKGRQDNFLAFEGSCFCTEDKWAVRAREKSRDDFKYYQRFVNNGWVDPMTGEVLTDISMSISKAKSLTLGSSSDSPKRYFTCLNGRNLEDELFYREVEEFGLPSMRMGVYEDEYEGWDEW